MEKYPKICVVGAGFSGICAGVKLKTKMGLENFTIFDENADFGGTWLLHTYPKAGCDVPSVFYSYSFEMNPEWSSMYCKQGEILQYLKNIATKHDLYSKAKFNHQIQALIWTGNKWRVRVLDKMDGLVQEHLFDFVIAGPGGLRIPNIPKEYSNFQGAVIHSAQWENSIELKDKVVAVIGSGTSAVQIIPGIVDDVKQLYSFQRRPAWVLPKPQIKFSSLTKSTFRRVPTFQRMLRYFVFWFYESGYLAFRKDSVFNSLGSWICKTHRNYQIKDAELRRQLTPDYSFACKRVAPSNEYFPALARKNVNVIRDKIEKVTKDSIIIEDGTEIKVDVIILATGYQVKEYFSPVKVFLSPDNCSTDALEPLRENPQHYLGIMFQPVPNFFLLMGPNSAVSHSSCLFPIEYQMEWIIQVVSKMMKDNFKVVQVTKGAQEKYMTKLLEGLKQTVYGAYDCNSWFMNDQKVITALNSGCLISYWRKVKKVRYEDLKFYN